MPKSDVDRDLNLATRDGKTKPYNKGEHSFKLLAVLDPTKVSTASPWAKRFIDCLKAKLG